jgi:hypothetical protein
MGKILSFGAEVVICMDLHRNIVGSDSFFNLCQLFWIPTHELRIKGTSNLKFIFWNETKLKLVEYIPMWIGYLQPTKVWCDTTRKAASSGRSWHAIVIRPLCNITCQLLTIEAVFLIVWGQTKPKSIYIGASKSRLTIGDKSLSVELCKQESKRKGNWNNQSHIKPDVMVISLEQTLIKPTILSTYQIFPQLSHVWFLGVWTSKILRTAKITHP